MILGIQTALSFSLKNNLLNQSDYHSIMKHIRKAELPSELKKFFKIKDINKIISFMIKDKKNSTEKIKLILLKKIGSPIIYREFKKKHLNSFLKYELRN